MGRLLCPFNVLFLPAVAGRYQTWNLTQKLEACTHAVERKKKNQIVSTCSAAHNHLPLPRAGHQSPQSAVAPALLQPLSTIDPARATISGPLTNIPLSVTGEFGRRPFTLLYKFRLSKPVSGRKEKKPLTGYCLLSPHVPAHRLLLSWPLVLPDAACGVALLSTKACQFCFCVMFGANVPELAKMWLGQADDIGYEYIFWHGCVRVLANYKCASSYRWVYTHVRMI